jgi:hypothetical protein
VSAIKLDKYGGMLPAWDARLLPDGQADFSRDCYLFSGTLTGWRQPKLLRLLNNSAAQFVYRIPNKDSNATGITATDSFWMEFLDPDTTVMRTPVVQDQFDRYYYASPSAVPRYSTYDRIVGGQNDWILGVPASGCAPGVEVAGGGDTTTIGFDTVGPSPPAPVYIPGNSIVLVPIVPTGAAIIQSVNFNPQTTDPTNVIGVMYADLNGAPAQLLGQTDPMPVSGSTQAIFTNGVSVISNVTYWIGFMTDQPYSLQPVDGTTQGATYANATFSNGAPSPLNASGITINTPTFNIWASMIGSSVYEARGYVYTWVTEYGEEGPPSPPVVVNGWSNATWTITLFQPTLNNMGGGTDVDGIVWPPDRNITQTNIYRTISNQSGMGTYFLVATVPVSQGVYVDTIDDATVALQAQLMSLYWYGPPEDLQAIIAFPNGIAVGFRKNEVWFAEAYRPHAWPPGYVITTEFPIVGIGVAGQSIVVCTQGTPYLIGGVNPSAMSSTKINLSEPCLHRGSIVATDTAVLYVSQNGLIQISQSGAGLNVTEGWVTREKWQALTPQTQVRAVKHATSYFAFGETGGVPIRRGYTVELSTQDQTSFTIWPQAGGHRLGFDTLSSPNGFDIRNVQLDAWTGVCLLVQGDGVYYYDFTDPNPIVVPYLWRSKVYQQNARRNFEAMRVFFSVPGTTPPQVDRDISFPQIALGPNQYGVVRVYVDDKLWCTREIRSSGELLRIFSGAKGEQWQWEVEGRVVIYNFQVATSVKELGII